MLDTCLDGCVDDADAYFGDSTTERCIDDCDDAANACLPQCDEDAGAVCD